jgi:hypothetical protein
VLTLNQTALAGDGGTSSAAAGGKAGAASSSLTFNDTVSANQSATVNANVAATGGAAGLGVTNGAVGAGAATLVLTGSGVVNGATSATGGTGVSASGTGTALTTVTGASGTYSAASAAALRPGKLIESVSAVAGGAADGTAVAKSISGIGGAAILTSTAYQAVAFIEGAPSALSTTAVLTANAAIKTAFGAAPVFFGIGELGGAYSTNGTATQTVTSSFSETVDLTKLTPLQDLVVGFYGGTAVGTGVTGVTFDLYADGVDVIHQTFSDAASAKAYFTNNAVDVGALGVGTLSSSTLTLKASLSVTSTSAGSGFFGSLIVGDPPAAHGSASTAGFTQAMAAMSSPKASLDLAAMTAVHSRVNLLATPSQFA